MCVHEARTPEQVRACFPVMRELRTQLDEDAFMERVQRQREDGYRLVYVEDGGEVVSVAGFRVLEMLSRAAFLYVDDLVTREDQRGSGYGARLLAWLREHASEQGASVPIWTPGSSGRGLTGSTSSKG